MKEKEFLKNYFKDFSNLIKFDDQVIEKLLLTKKIFLDTPVIGRSELKKTKTKGPLLIEEYDSVTVVPPNCKVSLDSEENIHINIS